MKPFADLLEALIFSPRRSVKSAHLVRWIKQTSFPDKGWGIAALIGELNFPHLKASVIRQLASETTDAQLFEYSYDFVGDLAETVALLWPAVPQQDAVIPPLTEITETLQAVSKAQAKEQLAAYLDVMTVSQRWACLKMATGGMRVGCSARMVRLALAEAYHADVAEIEEIWPLLTPPYTELFDWLEGRAERPSAEGRSVFRPMMLANPIEDSQLQELNLKDWQVEWKWDGARIQLVSSDEGVKLFSRSGDDMSAAFPELVTPMQWRGVLDGEILAGTPEQINSFNQLQQRLNRKKASVKLQQSHPVFLRFYDILWHEDNDVRGLPLKQRRQILTQQADRLDHPHFDISEQLYPQTAEALSALREECRNQGLIEGLMLKHRQSAYHAGRIKGYWFKWKRDPLSADLVMMYAQRGHGKRSSFYSDFSFGAWRQTEGELELVPVAKAYSGFTDSELKQLDKFVREHTTQKFGPVREVEHKLVVEIAFDSIHHSSRHKSGVAMRFPRFHAIRWDKPVEEAEQLDSLMQWIE